MLADIIPDFSEDDSLSLSLSLSLFTLYIHHLCNNYCRALRAVSTKISLSSYIWRDTRRVLQSAANRKAGILPIGISQNLRAGAMHALSESGKISVFS